jgi:hypothetical protein
MDVYSGLNAGLANLGQTYDDERNFAMKQQAMKRSNTLADLQIQENQIKLNAMQQAAGDQAQLRNSLANLQPTTSTVTTPNPMYGKPLDPGLAQAQADNEGEWTPSAVAVMRGAQGLPDQPGQETQQPTIQQTVTTPADPMKIIFDHAIKTGAYDDARKAIDMQSLVRNSSPDKIKQAEQLKDLGTFTNALKHVKEIKQAGVLTQSMLDGIYAMMPEQMRAQMPEGLKLTDVSNDGGLEVKDKEGNVIAHWAVSPDGTKTELVKAVKDDEGLLDKRLAAQAAMQQVQIDAADRRSANQIAAADRRSSQKANGPSKVLPAGQLESISDMKRVKDVMAEAGDLMKSGKVETGPVAGRLQSLGTKVGMASDDFVNVQQKLQTAQNIMLKLRSGAAVTESEYSRFLKEFPTPNDTKEVFDRKMTNAVNYATTLMDEKMNIYEEGGYKVPRETVGKGAKPAGGNKPIVTKSGFKVTTR